MLDSSFATWTIVALMLIGPPVSLLVHSLWRDCAPGEKGWRVVAFYMLDAAVACILASFRASTFIHWQQRKKGELKLNGHA